jgi:hypothetical protein
MLADTAVAHQVIQSHLAELRTAFADQGLQVNGLTVAVGGNSSAFDASAQQQNQWSGGPAHPGPIFPLHEEVTPLPTRRAWPAPDGLHLVDYQV